MFQFGMMNMGRLCRKAPVFALLSVVCMVFSIVGLLVVQEKVYANYLMNIQDAEESRMMIAVSEDTTVLPQVYAAISSEIQLPLPESVVFADNQCTGMLYDGENSGTYLYTPYGRFFNTQELIGKARVALVSTGYLERLPKDDLRSIMEDGIAVGGELFTVIGTYNLHHPENVSQNIQSHRAPTAWTIPLSTYMDMHRPVTMLRYVFSHELTENQSIVLASLLEAFEGVSYIRMPKSNTGGALSRVLLLALPYFSLVMLSFISMVSVVLFWYQSSYARYRAYMICGARPTHIAFFASFITFLLVTAGFLIALSLLFLLHLIMPENVLATLPQIVYVSTYAGILVFFLFIANVRMFRMSFSNRLMPAGVM